MSIPYQFVDRFPLLYGLPIRIMVKFRVRARKPIFKTDDPILTTLLGSADDERFDSRILIGASESCKKLRNRNPASRGCAFEKVRRSLDPDLDLHIVKCDKAARVVDHLPPRTLHHALSYSNLS